MVFEASNGAVPIMCETGIYSLGVIEIGEMYKPGVSRLAVNINAELGVVMDFGEDANLILELKVVPESNI